MHNKQAAEKFEMVDVLVRRLSAARSDDAVPTDGIRSGKSHRKLAATNSPRTRSGRERDEPRAGAGRRPRGPAPRARGDSAEMSPYSVTVYEGAPQISAVVGNGSAASRSESSHAADSYFDPTPNFDLGLALGLPSTSSQPRISVFFLILCAITIPPSSRF
ncbi:hypothetical protein EVAR_3324_1 [Eumeta japonica]|uniref:Uncharacterized protein n=1 Tax=Eumeta variegata TaxID=151549 RepID=A0A4C1SVX5_EUMVA|nr:hypothetical protein EVAR_3324_1 [Eumeta japonica]